VVHNWDKKEQAKKQDQDAETQNAKEKWNIILIN
jgi:hypothetical protein